MNATTDLFSLAQALAIINSQLPPQHHIAYWTLKNAVDAMEIPRIAQRIIIQREQMPALVEELRRRDSLPADFPIEL